MGVFKNEVGRPSNKTIHTRNTLKFICFLLITIILLLVLYIVNDKSKKEIIDIQDKKITKEEAKQIFDKYVFDGYETMFKNGFSSEYKTALAISKTESESNTYTCNDLYGDNLELWPGSKEGDKAYVVDELLCQDSNIKFYDYSDVSETYEMLFLSGLPLKSHISVSFSGRYGYSDLKDGYSWLSCECGGVPAYSLIKIYDAKFLDDELHISVGYIEYIDDANGDLSFKLANGKKIKIKTEFTLEDLEKEENISKLFSEAYPSMDIYEMVLEKDENDHIFKFKSFELKKPDVYNN